MKQQCEVLADPHPGRGREGAEARRRGETKRGREGEMSRDGGERGEGEGERRAGTGGERGDRGGRGGQCGTAGQGGEMCTGGPCVFICMQSGGDLFTCRTS